MEYIRNTGFVGKFRSDKIYEYLSQASSTVYDFDTQIEDCSINFDLINKSFDEYKCNTSSNYKNLIKKIFNKVQYISKDIVKKSYAENFKQLKDLMDSDKDPVTGESNYILITLIHNEMKKSNFWFTMYSLIELEKLGVKSNFMYSNFTDFRFSKDYSKLKTDPKYIGKKFLFLYTDDISYSGEQIVRFIKTSLHDFIVNPVYINDLNIHIFFNLINVTNRAFNWINKEINLRGIGRNNTVNNIFPNRLLLSDGSIDKTKYIKNMREILMEIYNEDTTKNPTIFPPKTATTITLTNKTSVKEEDDYLMKYIFYNDLYYIDSADNYYGKITIKSFFYNYFLKNITRYDELNPLNPSPSGANFVVTMSYLPFKYADHLSNFQYYCYINLIKALTIDIRKFFNITNDTQMMSLFSKYQIEFKFSYDYDKTNSNENYIFGLIHGIKNNLDRLGSFNDDLLKKLEHLQLGFESCKENKLIKSFKDGKTDPLAFFNHYCDAEISSYRQYKCPKTFYKKIKFDAGTFKLDDKESFIKQIDYFANKTVIMDCVSSYHNALSSGASYYGLKDYTKY